MYQQIQLPTDGSEHAKQAAAHAGWLARQTDGTVDLLAVVDVQGAAGLFNAGGADDQIISRLRASAEAGIDAVTDALDGVETTRAVLEGSPAAAIPRHARARDADLIVMGTHGRTGASRLVSGSVTEAVTRKVKMPVLVVHEADPELPATYESIVVATDGGPMATHATEEALGLAETTGATVHGVSVADVGGMARYIPDTQVGEFQGGVEQAAAEAATRVTELAEARSLEATSAVLEGAPVEELIGYLSETGADLLVVGTHGRRGTDRLLVGSTTERLIRRAEFPILAVHEPASAAD